MKPTIALRSFLLGSAFLAALTTAHAQTWDGSSSTSWTTGANWSGNAVPGANAAIIFDGTGANLNTSFNGTAFTLNSLTFTADQTAAVTINTVVGTPLTFNPGTVVSVAAGNHQFVGTGLANSGSNRDMLFAGTTGDSFTFSIAGGASFEIQGRVATSGTSASTRDFVKTGAGTLILSGFNGSSGSWNHSLGSGFQIQEGALRFAQLNAGGNSANNYIVSSGAALELQGGFAQGLGTGTYTLNGTGIASTGALRSISGNNSISGSSTGGISLATNSSIGVDADTLTISDDVKGNGTLTKVGAGTLTLSGANTYSGATTVSGGTLNISGTHAGTSYTVNGSGDPALKLSNVNALPASATISGSNSSALDGSVDLAVAGAYTMGSYDRGNITFTASSGPSSLTFTNASAITASANLGRTFTNASADLGITFASTLDIGGDSAANVTLNAVGDITVDGGIISTGAGARSLIKNGSGTLTLKGTSTHAGATTVTGGTLAVNGALTTTSVSVETGAKLQGSGTINSSVTIQSGGTLASGNSIESLGIGALSFAGASTYAYELQTDVYGTTPEVAGDLTYSSGTLDIAVGAILTLTDLAASTALANGSKLTLISYLGGWTGSELFSYNAGAGLATLEDDSVFTLGANQWLFNYNDTVEGANYTANSSGNYVTMTVVPEPTAALLGSLGVLALLRRRRN